MLDARRICATLLLSTAVLAPGAALAFSSDTLAGTWSGTWKNLKFKGVGGPFTIVISAPDANTIVVDASGANFGCGALGAPVTLVKGVDWTDTGGTKTFDTITLTYVEATRTLTGTGSNCHGTWTAKAKLKKTLKKLKGSTVTTLSGTSKKAPSKIRATRS
ncbi:MAG TPA: hypothetical protein VEM57_00355 [Candidatus Binatus sp.]|nr:hypothetical protein [Candidatus Binatus sp.]